MSSASFSPKVLTQQRDEQSSDSSTSRPHATGTDPRRNGGVLFPKDMAEVLTTVLEFGGSGA